MLLRDYIGRAANSYGDKAAYIEGDLHRSWGEIQERTDRLGRALQELGVRKGDRVCIMAHEHIEMVEHWLACAKIGAVRVGINWRYSVREQLHIIRDADAKAIVLQANCVASLAAHLDELRREGRALIGFGGPHDLEHDYEKIIAAAADRPKPVPLTGDDIISFSYTTGTTGLPKGVIWTHAAALESIVHSVLNLGMRREDVWLMPAPTPGAPILFNTFGVINGMTTALIGGDFTASGFWEIVERDRVTLTGGVPTMVRRALEELSTGHYDTSSLRGFSYGSAPMPPALIKEVYGTLNCELVQAYGSTETCAWVSYLREEDHRRALRDGDLGLLESAGRPSQHVDFAVFREDGMRTHSPDEIGEICVRGDTNTKGYHNAPPEQEDLYFGDWLRTGDLGRIDQEGFIYLVDRRKFMIISGGYNVYPVVVENVLSEHDAVREVAVVGAAHPEWGEAVTAVVSLKEGATVTPGELIQYSQSKLGKWQVPKHVEIVDDLPKGATAKIDKMAVREHVRSNPQVLPWAAE